MEKIYDSWKLCISMERLCDYAGLLYCNICHRYLTVQFYWSQKVTRETQAIDLFYKWNEMSIEEERINDTDHSSIVNRKFRHWYDNCKLTIIEAQYEVSHRSTSWVKTCPWMLEMERNCILESGFNGNTYSPRFRRYCQSAGYGLKSF
jgi:hypothetical protein